MWDTELIHPPPHISKSHKTNTNYTNQNQELELLVDTGSPALLLPVAPSPELGSAPGIYMCQCHSSTVHTIGPPSYFSPCSPLPAPRLHNITPRALSLTPTPTGRVIEEVPPSLDGPTAATPFSARNAAPTPTTNIDPSLPLAPPPLARLNHSLAGALLISCDDPRCTGHCHTPDASHFCGPHGGSCTRSPLAPPKPPTTNNKQRAPGPGALATLGGAGSLPPHVPAEQCSFNWSYGAGQYASRATGVLMRGSVALGPLVVPDATFGAILKVRCGGLLGADFCASVCTHVIPNKLT